MLARRPSIAKEKEAEPGVATVLRSVLQDESTNKRGRFSRTNTSTDIELLPMDFMAAMATGIEKTIEQPASPQIPGIDFTRAFALGPKSSDPGSMPNLTNSLTPPPADCNRNNYKSHRQRSISLSGDRISPPHPIKLHRISSGSDSSNSPVELEDGGVRNSSIELII